jgi:Na+/H+-dicarboxylate symporter
MKKLALHWQIIIGMIAGVLAGLLAGSLGTSAFVKVWISPFGTIFINLLKLIAVPLVLVSLIVGMSNLKDISRLSRMGTKTFALFLLTTIMAITIGLLTVNIVNPGLSFSPEKREELKAMYSSKVEERSAMAQDFQTKGPLQFVVDAVPENLFMSLGDNKRMLQVIFFALLFGVAMVMLPEKQTETVRKFFMEANDIVLKIVDIIMKFAPYGVFALMAGMVADFSSGGGVLELFQALGLYSFAVIFGLFMMLLLVYPLMLKIFTKIPVKKFYQDILPAQMLGFSTSSSAAALPVTMKCSEEKLGLREEVTSFCLPIGATVNMDGTSLYQAVAAVFIAQAFGVDLSLGQQLTIVVMATLASIGAAPVPGAGMVMLIVILQSVGLNAEGLGLIFAVDRILDMFRTVVNITSNVTVAAIVDRMEYKQT